MALLCWSCSKDDFTKPAGINLQMAIENHEVEINKRVKVNSIKIESGRYLLSEVEFKGYRESGEDYFFEKEFEDGLEATMTAESPAIALNFDMPQGLYKRISISFKVKKSKEREEDEEDEKPFDENASLILQGTYTDSKEQEIPLVFVYNYDDTFEFKASSAKSKEVILIEEGQGVAHLTFNPSYWLQLINSRMLESAQLTPVNGVPSIVLSEQQNEHIFELLASRIKSASDLSFE